MLLEALIVAALSVIGGLLTNSYYYGRLTQKVSDHGGRLDKLEEKVDGHGNRISLLEGRMGD